MTTSTSSMRQRRGPKASTLAILRQFARSYRSAAVLAPAALGGYIAN